MIGGARLSSTFLRCVGSVRLVSTGVSPLKLYGHYASQPVRSVAWLLKMKHVPFEFTSMQLMNGEAKKPEYVAKFPLATAPGLDDNGFCLGESAAILQYLCEKHGWSDWYPAGSDSDSIRKRALINEYLANHHSSTRRMTLDVVRYYYKATFGKQNWDAAAMVKYGAVAKGIAKTFEANFLLHHGGPYIGGMQHPTIADLMAYTEIAQVEQCGIAKFDETPELKKWLARMASLPEHENVHQTLMKIAKMGGLI